MVPAALEIAMEEDVEFRQGLPLDYLTYMGVQNSDKVIHLLFLYIYVSPPVTVAITHLWIFTAQVLLVCLRMTHAGRNSSHASRA